MQYKINLMGFDGGYSNLAENYLFIIAGMLNSVLEKHKLDIDTRRIVCEDFMFDFAMFHDQGDIDVERNQYEPLIAFFSDEGKISLNPKFTGFHELVFSRVEAALEDAENRKKKSYWKKK